MVTHGDEYFPIGRTLGPKISPNQNPKPKTESTKHNPGIPKNN